MKKNFPEISKMITQQILWPEFAIAVLSLMPIFLSAWLFDNILFLKVGLVTISLFIAANRLKYNFVMVTLHYIIILVGFSLLYFSIHQFKILFVFLCSFMALGSILLSRYGSGLRTLANYTFIPSVYLACELQAILPPHQNWLEYYTQFITISPLAWCTMAIIYILRRTIFLAPVTAAERKVNHINFLVIPNKGEPLIDWIVPASAIFVGVFISSLLAVMFNVDSPEWLIWSTASVITTELFLSHIKFMHRLVGAVVGIIVGLCISPLLPHTQLIYSLSLLGIMLTLTSFKSYFISFSSRCFFITLAAYAISTSHHTALMRVQNVFIGGAIGICSLYGTYYLVNKLR